MEDKSYKNTVYHPGRPEACPKTSSIYQPRNPRDSAYYRCVEDHFETFEQVYEERFERQYGFFRSYVRKVIYRYPWPRPGLLCKLQGIVS